VLKLPEAEALIHTRKGKVEGGEYWYLVLANS